MAIKDRGFASMSKEDRVRIARMGGKASGKKTKSSRQRRLFLSIDYPTSIKSPLERGDFFSVYNLSGSGPILRLLFKESI